MVLGFLAVCAFARLRLIVWPVNQCGLFEEVLVKLYIQLVKHLIGNACRLLF